MQYSFIHLFTLYFNLSFKTKYAEVIPNVQIAFKVRYGNSQLIIEV